MHKKNTKVDSFYVTRKILKPIRLFTQKGKQEQDKQQNANIRKEKTKKGRQKKRHTTRYKQIEGKKKIPKWNLIYDKL